MVRKRKYLYFLTNFITSHNHIWQYPTTYLICPICETSNHDALVRQLMCSLLTPRPSYCTGRHQLYDYDHQGIDVVIFYRYVFVTYTIWYVIFIHSIITMSIFVMWPILECNRGESWPILLKSNKSIKANHSHYLNYNWIYSDVRYKRGRWRYYLFSKQNKPGEVSSKTLNMARSLTIKHLYIHYINNWWVRCSVWSFHGSKWFHDPLYASLAHPVKSTIFPPFSTW